MTEQDLELLKTRVSEGNRLLAYLKKCKENVILYTRYSEASEELSNRQEWSKKKLNEWLSKLDKAKQQFKDF